MFTDTIKLADVNRLLYYQLPGLKAKDKHTVVTHGQKSPNNYRLPKYSLEHIMYTLANSNLVLSELECEREIQCFILSVSTQKLKL